MDFSSYNLAELRRSSGGVYDLAGYTIRQIANAFGVPLGERPTEEVLRQLVHEVGRKETLQDNISHAEVVLSQNTDSIALGDDATSIGARWLKRAGVMKAVAGSFSAPAHMGLPSDFDAVVLMGGVANWMRRRSEQLLRIDPEIVGTVILAAGNRIMGIDEHQLVRTPFTKRQERLTEYEFCKRFIAPTLRDAEFDVTLLPEVHSPKGNDVCAAAAEKAQERHALNGTVLVIGNAPGAIHQAGAFRVAARQLNPTFDNFGSQLFMMGDPFLLAEHGESKDTHQNPVSGLGQLCRDALFLHLASQSIAV